jgi:hypothetical protein
MIKHNWEEIQAEADEFGEWESVLAFSRIMRIPYTTVTDAITAGKLILTLTSPEANKVEFKETGNEAMLKFNSAKPLTAEEAAKVAGVDLTVWKIESQNVNMWQMGRKDREMDVSYEAGAATGHIKDTGQIKKTYLYQITVKLTRRKRIAVHAVLEPIQVNMASTPDGSPTWVQSVLQSQSPKPKNKEKETVLFIADPHFGFEETFEGMEPFHLRTFLSDLLTIGEAYQPDYVVWNGDLLDLADFSTFPTNPQIVHKTQLAAIEASYVLGRFGQWGANQVLIEGNHEVRLGKSMQKNLTSAYGLRPALDLEGESLLSVPRLLGLKDLGVTWVGDYPDGYFQVGEARFSHGSIVRQGLGKTIGAVSDKSVVSNFFGHIHRYEAGTRRVDGVDGLIWSASPGCACSLKLTPGVKRVSNWSNGAFFISLVNGKIRNVDHILHTQDGETFFRGQRWARTESYLDEFLHSIPKSYRRRF